MKTEVAVSVTTLVLSVVSSVIFVGFFSGGAQARQEMTSHSFNSFVERYGKDQDYIRSEMKELRQSLTDTQIQLAKATTALEEVKRADTK